MPITKDNVCRHEIIGLQARVTDSRNPAYVGISGKIINETQKIIVIRDKEPKQLFKDAIKLELELPDKTKAEVDGKDLLGRPWDRVKKDG